MSYWLFPFDRVPKGSKVVIYGAGNVGQAYLAQIEQTNWCDVLCLADSDCDRYRWMSVPVCNPEGLFLRVSYDCVVIAIEALPIVEKIKSDLANWGIPMEKIINVSERYLHDKKKNIVLDDGDELYEDDIVRIAYKMVGSMGTYIIYRRLLDEIVKICPTCAVDVFGKEGIARFFFEECPYVRGIMEYNQFHEQENHYDIVLKVGHIIRLEQLQHTKVDRLCPELAEKLKRLYDEFPEYYCNLPPEHCTDNMFIRKAGFLGINRYTALGHNGIFDLADKKVDISIDESYEEKFEKLKLGRYITFNRGAAAVPGEDREQVKIWPKEHFETFFRQFKNGFSDVEVVQIGDESLEKLGAADRHYMGESFELVKYILKNALFHLDCEGGLVHVATQLGTKCIVLFGPTSVQYFGYEQNVNLATDICKDCRMIAADWMVNCYRNGEKQICMKSISPEMVLKEAEKLIR